MVKQCRKWVGKDVLIGQRLIIGISRDLHTLLNERINERETIAKAPERQALIDGFEKSRAV